MWSIDERGAGEVIASCVEVPGTKDVDERGGYAERLRGELFVGSVKPWSAESPNLYRVTVTLRDALDSLLETEAFWVGFRNVDIVGGLLCINGKPLMIRGERLTD